MIEPMPMIRMPFIVTRRSERRANLLGNHLSAAMFAVVALAVYTGWVPISGWLDRQEAVYRRALYQLYKPNMSPRTTAWQASRLSGV
jgi:hypothetical protein